MANNIVDRTTLTAAVDDDGSNTTGTVETKAWLASVMYDPVEAVVSALFGVCQGRLTLLSGTAVTTADQTAKTTVYFTPYLGARIGLYTGSQWVMRTFAELSIAVPATTSKVYDVFVYDNAGSAALELSATWTSDTAIFASGTYQTTRPVQDGIYVKSTDGTAIDATRRYVGSFRTTTVSGQTEVSLAKVHVWNYYNRVRRPVQRIETNATWSYNTNTIRQANGSTANQIDVLVGVAEVALTLDLVVSAVDATSANDCVVGFGEDSTTVFTGPVAHATANLGSFATSFKTSLAKAPAIGRHFYAWLEVAQAAGGTVTWQGVGGSNSTTYSSGMTGTFEC